MFKLELGENLCSNKEYHSDKSYFSSSQLKTLRENPAQFYEEHILGKKIYETKPAYDLGTLTHTMVLEPELLHQEVAVFHGMRKQGGEWEKFKTENANNGKLIVSASQMHMATKFVNALGARPEVQKMLVGGRPEISVCQIVNGVPVKKRSDYINIEAGYILDVKTTSDASDPELFKMAVERFGYGFSAGQYTAIAEQFYGRKFDFYWAVVSKTDVAWELYKCSAKRLAEGQQQFFESLEVYKKCKESGLWLTPEVAAATVVETQTYEVQEI